MFGWLENMNTMYSNLYVSILQSTITTINIAHFDDFQAKLFLPLEIGHGKEVDFCPYT